MSLRILLDQNVPRSVCALIQESRPHCVVTFDEDFADARMFPVGSHSGVIRLRVWPTTVEKTQAALARLFLEIHDDELPGSLVIVDEVRIRVRRAIRHG